MYVTIDSTSAVLLLFVSVDFLVEAGRAGTTSAAAEYHFVFPHSLFIWIIIISIIMVYTLNTCRQQMKAVLLNQWWWSINRA